MSGVSNHAKPIDWDDLAKKEPPRPRGEPGAAPKPMLGLAEDRMEPGVKYSPKVRLRDAATVRRHRQP